MKIISRPFYTNRILKFLNKGMIIALTGQRRVGKSYILRDLQSVLSKSNPDANIIFVNKEKKDFEDIKTGKNLNEYLEGKILDGAANYLLIDEVQDIVGFENTLRSLNADDECQIIVTGSNAKMFSSELSTYLGGRYIDIHVHSLSYPEFLEFHRLDDTQETLEKYLYFGGLPHLYRLGLENEDMVWDYIQNIYNTIVLKDVIQREGIRNVTMFENLLSFISDNTGQLVSANSLSKYLKSQNVELTPLTAINYLKAASNAYIVNKVGRFDIHGKRLLESIDKYYFEDLGLRNGLVHGAREKDIEKLIENAVYLHLTRMGYKVSVGVMPNAEIDFIAEKQKKKMYIQVAYLLTNEKTRQREFGNLSKIDDNYPKYVVSMDNMSISRDNEGITHIGLRKFLQIENL